MQDTPVILLGKIRGIFRQKKINQSIDERKLDNLHQGTIDDWSENPFNGLVHWFETWIGSYFKIFPSTNEPIHVSNSPIVPDERRGFSQCDAQQLEAVKPCLDPSKCPKVPPWRHPEVKQPTVVGLKTLSAHVLK